MDWYFERTGSIDWTVIVGIAGKPGDDYVPFIRLAGQQLRFHGYAAHYQRDLFYFY